MATSDNLKEAFAGESQANRKYLAFAKKAGEEGFPQIARLFRAAGAAETVHAHAHLEVMGGVRRTADNLQAAVDGEAAEFREMYPGFVAEAEAEGERAAAMSFKNALAVEEIHHGLYADALNTLNEGNDLPEERMCVCNVCGNTVAGEAPDKCPICGSPKSRFFEVE
ncbi:MAG: rubrerythrin family protein [Planctomycetota bacterium]